MNIARALQELDLQTGATEEEIRDAYRKLVATWHPDKYQNNPAKLHEAELRIKNINAAFEKLQANGFRTSRKANNSSKTASSTSTADQKKSEQATSGQGTQSSRRPFYRSPQLQLAACLVCIVFAFIAGLNSSNEKLKSEEYERKISFLQSEIRSLEKQIVTIEERQKPLEEQVKPPHEVNTQLKDKIKAMMGRDYIIEQIKQFSQKDRLEIAAIWREELDPDFKIELVNETIPPRLDDTAENVARVYYRAIGPTRQKRILENTDEIRTNSEPPQNIHELEERVREISDAKDNVWKPFYMDMLGVRSEACNNAVRKLNELLGSIVGQKDWEDLIRQEREKITEEQESLRRLRELNQKVATNETVNRLKEEFINEFIQGRWSRVDHTFRFLIKGERWDEFLREKPLELYNTGKIELKSDKPYAFIHANGGQKLYLFPISRDIMAVETILADGTIYGDGRIFYRGDDRKIEFD